MNLVYKLFATYLLLAIVVILTVNSHLGGHIKNHLKDKTEQGLLIYAKLINVTASIQEMERTARYIAETSGTRVTLIDTRGVVLADTEYSPGEMENHYDRPEVQEARIRGTGSSTRLSRTLNIETLYVAVVIEDSSRPIGYIRLARPLTDVRDSMNALNWALMQSFVLIGVIAFIIAFVFSQRLVSPIQEMEEFTTKLQQGEFPGTLLISAADERGRLARNINYLVMELREKIDWATEEKSKLQAAFASMTDGVLILDERGRIEIYNDAFRSMFPGGFRSIIGATPLETFKNVALQEALDRFSKEGDILSEEITIDNGHTRTVEVTICPIQGLPNHELKTMMVFHDVTRLKQLERMRADFVANVTHEIKTPLAAILGYLETLREGALDDRSSALQFLDIMARHAERLNRLVDDLLILSDLELGDLPLRREPVSLESLLNGLWPIVESQAVKKGVDLAREVPDHLPDLRGDRDRLVQILLNVLDNAVKFTDAGGSVKLTAEHRGGDTLDIRIADSGIGIPSHDLARLGERFYRVDRARSRQSGGTGLGLSIVKHLMAAHGGRMDITSEPGRGTIVRLTFPVA